MDDIKTRKGVFLEGRFQRSECMHREGRVDTEGRYTQERRYKWDRPYTEEGCSVQDGRCDREIPYRDTVEHGRYLKDK